MDLIKYVGKVVKVELNNGYFFVGTVEQAEKDSIFLIDRNGKPVDIKASMIAYIREVE